MKYKKYHSLFIGIIFQSCVTFAGMPSNEKIDNYEEKLKVLKQNLVKFPSYEEPPVASKSFESLEDFANYRNVRNPQLN